MTNMEKIQIAFFGTSLTDVNDWQTNSFVQIIENKYPYYDIHNFGIGGANSFKILNKIKEVSKTNKYDVAFIEMGTNDIFRKHQGRLDEAVSIKNFIENYRKSIKVLKKISKKVVCISSPPVSNSFEYNMNEDIDSYNIQVQKMCLEYDSLFINAYDKFDVYADLWTDGIHLNKAGDGIIAELIINELKDI